MGYTAKPTAGSTIGKIYAPVSIGTGDVITIDFGDVDGSKPPTIRTGQSIALVTDTNSTISYMMEFSEE